jgi:hypothetical protein
MESTIADVSPPGATIDLLVTAFCGFVVAFYAWERYNTPDTNRVSTTRSLFLFTGAGYVSMSLALFLLLSIALAPEVLLLPVLEGLKKILAQYSAPPVTAAVLLTILLPNTPIVSSADKWLIERFQRWGRIPQGVQNLADNLTPKALQLQAANLRELQEWIAADGEVPDDLAKLVSIDPPESSRGSLARVLRLYIELQKLEATPGYRSAFRSTQAAWQAIKEEFRVFVAQSQPFFFYFDELNRIEGSAGENALNRAEKSYRDICRKMHRDMTEFLAQLVVMVEGSDQRISHRLQSIGFGPLAQPGPHMQVGPFLFLGAMMIFGVLGVVSVLSPQRAPLLPPVVNAILIGTTRTIGILAAVLPKMRWSNRRPDSLGNPRYLDWLGWASVAAIFSLAIERATISIYYGKLTAGLDFAAFPLGPLAPMAFATSLVISILCDVDLHLGQGWARRVSEGLLSAVAAAVSIYICTHLLLLTASEVGVWIWMPYAISSGLGFVSGFFAPYLYRRATDEEPIAQMAPNHRV